MSGQDDAEEQHRYHPPHNERHQIPTIGKFREEKERRQSAAAQYGSVTSGQQNGVENQQDIEAQDRETKQHTEREQTQAEQHDENVQPVDTSEADAAATDPKARRKEQKHRKDERAEREVTDPVTHLPVSWRSEGLLPADCANRTLSATSGTNPRSYLFCSRRSVREPGTIWFDLTNSHRLE